MNNQRTKKVKIDQKVRKVGTGNYKVTETVRDSRNRLISKTEGTVRIK